MSWTDERIATLKKMWEGGSTASQIADELGGVSRVALLLPHDRVTACPTPPPAVNCIWSHTVHSKLCPEAPGPIAF